MIGNGNKEVLHLPPNFKTGASPSDAVYHPTQYTEGFQVLLSNTNNSIQHHSFVSSY